jgi:hypothetical protein
MMPAVGFASKSLDGLELGFVLGLVCERQSIVIYQDMKTRTPQDGNIRNVFPGRSSASVVS